MSNNSDYRLIDESEFEIINQKIGSEFSSIGLEYYPFKIGWYNEKVSPEYRLPYDNSCLAFVILSSPEMFEKAFIPFIRTNQLLFGNKVSDPIDQCMKYHFNRLKKIITSYELIPIHDFELHLPNRRPKVLVQTAAHVSGAAFYYKSDNYQNSDKPKNIGVCIHPQFGGWFAIRGVLIFPYVLIESLQQKQPLDVLKSDGLKRELLNKFNNWKDWSYRDIIPVVQKYSNLQIQYFSSKPCDRLAFLEENFEQINQIIKC